MVDFHENVYLRNGDQARDHIPAMPFWMAILRAVQVLFAILVMILAAYAMSIFSVSGFPGYGMAIFVFVWTLLFIAYIFVTPLWFPEFYLYWVHLGLEVVSVIFWLTTFALLAQEVDALKAVDQLVNLVAGYTSTIPGVVDGSSAALSKFHSASGATKGATAFAALNWFLFIASLSFFGVFLHKHRVAHGATLFIPQKSAPRDVEAGAEKPVATGQQQVELNSYPQQQQQQVPVASQHAADYPVPTSYPA